MKKPNLHFFEKQIFNISKKGINTLLGRETDVEVQMNLMITLNNLVSLRDSLRVTLEATEVLFEATGFNDDVFVWLNETEIFILEAENLTAQTKTRQQKKKCKKLLIKLLAHPYNFPGFCPLFGLKSFSFENIGSQFVYFKSREKASNQLLVALLVDKCSLIGLYGRSGSGKTTLVKAVCENIKEAHFLKVLFVKVTENSNIGTIQDEIADLLDIKLDKNSEVGRANIISSRMENMYRRILMIFDDVRAKFNPEDVGIPCNSNNCKILLTTCCQQDSDLMYSQYDIQLGPLSTEESWTLFQKHSRIDDEEYSSSIDLLNVAREIAFECEGLPGKIKDVGSSLKSKPIEEWKATLDSLKHSIAKWQIFLSFRGDDTRYAFTGNLYKALCEGGFKTFMDDGGLQTGDQISPSLLNAIEASRLSIIVLYANSSWCLEELVKILECQKSKNQIVWPIFYKVEPSDIRHLKKCYGKHMAQHEKNYGINSEKVQKWKSALFEVSNLSGKTYKTGYEHEFIQKIVEDANQIKSRLQIRSI